MCAIVLAIAGPVAGCAAAVDRQAISDAQTAARVKTALVNDSELGPRTIEVRVVNGVAHLAGRVASDLEIARAVAVARAVPGVIGVESGLQIGAEPPPDPPASDGGRRRDLGRDLEEELAELEAVPRLLAVGLNASRTFPLEPGLGPRVSFPGTLVKIGWGRGFEPVVGFSWYHTDLTATSSGGTSVNRLHVRPLMGGIGYTVGPDRLAVTASIAAGVAFNSVAIRDPGGGPLAINAANSFVWRPNVAVWRNLTRRTVLNVSVAYIDTRLRVTFVDEGLPVPRRVNASTVMVSTGIAYRVF